MEKLSNDEFKPTVLPVWLVNEENSVLCSSVCLNRNIKGFKFPAKASPEDLKKVGAKILGKINSSDLSNSFRYARLSDMSFEMKGRVYERRINFYAVDVNDERLEENVILLIKKDESASILINGDDHLQVRVSLPGNKIEECLKSAEEIMDQIKLDFSYKDPFGFLTSSPAIMGSGLQLESMVHIPGIALIVEPELWIGLAKKSGIIPEGFWGYSTAPMGNMFTLCNQNTHRKKSNDSIKEFNSCLKKIIKIEKESRKDMGELEKKDFVMRSYGTLRYVQKIDLSEALAGLSLVKMGIQDGVIKNVSEETINKLTFYIFPSQLKSLTNCDPDSSDVVRADLIRKALSVRKKE